MGTDEVDHVASLSERPGADGESADSGSVNGVNHRRSGDILIQPTSQNGASHMTGYANYGSVKEPSTSELWLRSLRPWLATLSIIGLLVTGGLLGRWWFPQGAVQPDTIPVPTVTVPGPVQTVPVPGPTVTVPGPVQTVTATAPSTPDSSPIGEGPSDPSQPGGNLVWTYLADLEPAAIASRHNIQLFDFTLRGGRRASLAGVEYDDSLLFGVAYWDAEVPEGEIGWAEYDLGRRCQFFDATLGVDAGVKDTKYRVTPYVVVDDVLQQNDANGQPLTELPATTFSPKPIQVNIEGALRLRAGVKIVRNPNRTNGVSGIALGNARVLCQTE